MEAISMMLAGYSTLNLERLMVIFRSSRGCLSTSSTARRNSGSSSKNRIPWWASDISPGWGQDPPPTSATSDMVWCGERKGREVIKEWLFWIFPATEWIFVVSKASSIVMGGRIVGNLRASMVFPEPGEPIMIMLCPPAAATSIARFTFSCSFTSLKSSKSSSGNAVMTCWSKEMGEKSFSCFRKVITSFRWWKP